MSVILSSPTLSVPFGSPLASNWKKAFPTTQLGTVVGGNYRGLAKQISDMVYLGPAWTPNQYARAQLKALVPGSGYATLILRGAQAPGLAFWNIDANSYGLHSPDGFITLDFPTFPTSGTAFVNLSPDPGPDQMASCRCLTYPPANGVFMGPAVRMKPDPSGNFSFYRMQVRFDGTFFLTKLSANSPYQEVGLATVNLFSGIAGYKFTLGVQGNQLSCYVNDVLMTGFPVTDAASDALTSGMPGIVGQLTGFPGPDGGSTWGEFRAGAFPGSGSPYSFVGINDNKMAYGVSAPGYAAVLDASPTGSGDFAPRGGGIGQPTGVWVWGQIGFASYVATITPQVNDIFAFAINGDRFFVFHNGTQILSDVVNTSFPSGAPGVAANAVYGSEGDVAWGGNFESGTTSVRNPGSRGVIF